MRPEQRHRPFDQPRDLVQQAVVGHHLQRPRRRRARRCPSSMIRSRSAASSDDAALRAARPRSRRSRAPRRRPAPWKRWPSVRSPLARPCPSSSPRAGRSGTDVAIQQAEDALQRPHPGEAAAPPQRMRLRPGEARAAAPAARAAIRSRAVDRLAGLVAAPRTRRSCASIVARRAVLAQEAVERLRRARRRAGRVPPCRRLGAMAIARRRDPARPVEATRRLDQRRRAFSSRRRGPPRRAPACARGFPRNSSSRNSACQSYPARTARARLAHREGHCALSASSQQPRQARPCGRLAPPAGTPLSTRARLSGVAVIRQPSRPPARPRSSPSPARARGRYRRRARSR